MALPWEIISENVLNVAKILDDLLDTSNSKDVDWIVKNEDGTVDSKIVPNLAKLAGLFGKRYVGASDTPPAKRLDGTAIEEGDMYFDTVKKQMMVYNGTEWKPVVYPAALIKASFTGDGNTTEFTVEGGYEPNMGMVFLNGVNVTNEVDLTSGTVIKFKEAPADGDIIEAYFYNSFKVADAYTKTEAENIFVKKDEYKDEDILNKIKNVDGEGSGLDADLFRGLTPNQFLRSDTKKLDLSLDNNTGANGKFVIKTLGSVADTKPGLILFAKKYNGTYLFKQGFEGFVFVNRGNPGAYNISQMFKVVCVSAYDTTKLWLEGNSTGAYLVEAEYNGEIWYGLYLKTPTSKRNVTIIGQLWGDPIFINDASGYTVTRVTSNDGYNLGQNGYQLLPNGLIMQWGLYIKDTAFSHNYTFTITYPIAFPNTCLSFISLVSPGVGSSKNDTYNFGSVITQNKDGIVDISNTSVKVKVFDMNGNSPDAGKGHLWWFAIGY